MARDPRQNTPHAVVVLPTYNERENIAQVLEALLLQAHRFPQAKLSTFTQRWLTVYLLVASQLQSLWLAYFPFSLWLMLSFKMPMVLTLFSFVPIYLLAIQFIVYSVGMVEFTRDYRLKFFWWLPFKLLGTFLLFQLLLGISALRALWRLIRGNVAWEKTQHLNQHRSPLLNFARE